MYERVLRERRSFGKTGSAYKLYGKGELEKFFKGLNKRLRKNRKFTRGIFDAEEDFFCN